MRIPLITKENIFIFFCLGIMFYESIILLNIFTLMNPIGTLFFYFLYPIFLTYNLCQIELLQPSPKKKTKG